MARRSNKAFNDLNITKSELKELGEAFKNKEFLQLFADYAKEVNDPNNKATFESELKQLEKERGNDITFIYPKPGYVIKSSADGYQKAFVNICHNENIGKPSATRAEQYGTVGLNWSVPFTHVKGRVDLDKKRNYCLFYDVVFHPDTIYLAKKNAQFRQLVNDTALSAVEDVNGIKLDRKNLKFPKASYKGPVQSSIIRKKLYKTDEEANEKTSDDNGGLFDIPNYPYPKLEKDPEPSIRIPRSDYENDDECRYTTPTYQIKQRKGIDFQEYTNAVDAKVHSSIPSELVIEIELPLVKSAADVSLDVIGKSLSLISQKSAKYKLDITLPYTVNEDNGSAKFDRHKKQLIVVLPVKRRQYTHADFMREDSGIESDPNHTNISSSEEDISKDIEVISSKTVPETTTKEEEQGDSDVLRTSEEIKNLFLKPDRHYMFPPFTIFECDGVISITLDVKNVDPSTIQHQFVSDNEGVHISFASLGSGYFPVYYAFFFKISDTSLDTSSLKIEVWDNNILANLSVVRTDQFRLVNYFAGLEPLGLKEYCHNAPPQSSSQKTEVI